MIKSKMGIKRGLCALIALMAVALGAGTAMAQELPDLPAPPQLAEPATGAIAGGGAEGDVFTVNPEGGTQQKHVRIFGGRGSGSGMGMAYGITGEAGGPGMAAGGSMSFQTGGGKGMGGCCNCQGQGGNMVFDRRVEPPKGAPGAAGKQFMFKNENGAMSHSTDGGATWTEGLPEGANMTTTVDGDKVTTQIQIEDAAPAAEPKLAFENGALKYSLDGGATWTLELPEGYEVVSGEDGSLALKLK